MGLWEPQVPGRARTLCAVLQGAQPPVVDAGVDADSRDAGWHTQALLGTAQDGHLQHGVQEGHPIVLPQQLAGRACGEGVEGHSQPCPVCPGGPSTRTWGMWSGGTAPSKLALRMPWKWGP